MVEQEVEDIGFQYQVSASSFLGSVSSDMQPALSGPQPPLRLGSWCPCEDDVGQHACSAVLGVRDAHCSSCGKVRKGVCSQTGECHVARPSLKRGGCRRAWSLHCICSRFMRQTHIKTGKCSVGAGGGVGGGLCVLLGCGPKLWELGAGSLMHPLCTFRALRDTLSPGCLAGDTLCPLVRQSWFAPLPHDRRLQFLVNSGM